MIEIRGIDPIAKAISIVSLWNGRAAAEFPLDERLLAQQLGMESGPKECLGAFDSGVDLVGVALFKAPREPLAESSRGSLSFIVVDEKRSRRGVGSRLLDAGELWLAGRGAKGLAFGRDSYHFFPGMPLDDSPASRALRSFLEGHGFVRDEEPIEEDLIADLGELDLPALASRSPLAPGYRFVLYDPALRPRVEAFFASEFPGRWRSDTFEALDAGMRPCDLGILLDENSGDVVGFSRIYDERSPILGPGVYWRAAMGQSPGGLGPIGVSRSVRGKGLGLALLRLCLEELASRGVRRTVIDWTSLSAFYAKMGFAPWKAYGLCSKALSRKGRN
jgi:GNAT superfamily N-acetyltransferase